MKRTFVYLIILLLVFVTSVSAKSNQLDSNSEEVTKNSDAFRNAVQFRKLHGFEISDEYIMKSLQEDINTPAEELFGFPITDEERMILEKRQKVEDAIPLLTKKINHNTSLKLSGMYYSSEEGKIIVSVKNKKKHDELIINNLVESLKDEITVVNTNFSESELTEAFNVLLDHFTLKGTLVYMDVKTNKVVIQGEIDDKQKIKIKSMLQPGIIDFVEEFSFHDQSTPNDKQNSSQSKIWLGSKIVRDNTGNKCSTGLYGQIPNVSSPGTYLTVLVTAGHCDSVGSTNAWYHPTMSSSNLIGYWKYRTSGNTTADAGYISLTNSNIATARACCDGTGKLISSVHNGSESAGQIVYTIGAGSNTTISGKITHTNAVLNQNSNGFNSISGLTVTDASTSSGDSGAAVYSITYAGGTDYPYLRGVHKGIVGSGGYGQIYSYIQNVKSTLGLTSIRTTN
ncbi:hypothetical protein [Marinicrinis sediminis]|uniref:Peptidase S1 domain-containing protein n=1 Tax=Marinicrinis sediminis TaxID=1652465 RepID=A0ABW5R8H0_9BACL